MSRSKKSIVAMFALAALLTLAGPPRRADAQILTPMTGRWTAPFPNGQKTVQFQPGILTTPDGSVIGRFSIQGQFAGQPPFNRVGEYSFRPTGPGRAFVQVRYDDNGQVETDNEHLVGTRITFLDVNGNTTFYLRN